MTETPNKRKFDLDGRTLRFAKMVVSLCRKLEKGIVNREIIGQLTRSACSVGANYREANEALSKKDFSYRIKICLKEAKESSYWLDILREGNNEHHEEIISLFREAVELKKIFCAIAEKS